MNPSFERTCSGSCAAYLTMLIADAGMFGIFLFLTYYLQRPGSSEDPAEWDMRGATSWPAFRGTWPRRV